MDLVNKIILGDCLEVMKEIPDESIDMILTDPPYLMNYKSNRRVVKEKFDHILNDKNAEGLITTYIKECYRILKPDSALYMFCSWHKVDLFKQEVEKYFNLKNLIVWNKNNHGSGDLKGAYAPKHELILYAHKGRSLFRCKRIPDVIDFPKISSDKLVHPTEKPIGLLELFIQNNSDPGNVIFDGFAGSGTTSIAALNTGRSFICIEKDERYFNIAKERIECHAKTACCQ